MSTMVSMLKVDFTKGEALEEPEGSSDAASQCVLAGRQVLEAEARGLRLAAQRLGAHFQEAVRRLSSHPGKVIVAGLGKSGHVARKIAATFCSTGTPAVFLHAAEAMHGDLGVYTPGDPTILISKSGSTEELIRLIPVLRSFASPLVGILGNLNSPLARSVDLVIDGSVEREADPNNLAPTSSSTVALGLGDALAIAVMQARRFTHDDFARYHPGGQLGRNLLLRVNDVMHTGPAVAWVSPNQPVRQVLIEMTRKPLGAACVVDGTGGLLGIITDGDIRRALERHEDILSLRSIDIMTPEPVRIRPTATLNEAAFLMENRPSQISVLPVVEEDGRCVGLLRIHDLYRGSPGKG